jgi:hypothetical protein
MITIISVKHCQVNHAYYVSDSLPFQYSSTFRLNLDPMHHLDILSSWMHHSVSLCVFFSLMDSTIKHSTVLKNDIL